MIMTLIAYRNELLYRISQRLSRRRPNWDRIMETAAPLFESSNVPTGGKLAEMHLRVALEEINDELEARDRVVFDPISHDDSTRNYYFTNYESGLRVLRKSDGQVYSEIDDIVVVDGLPVLFEIKTGKNYRKSPSNRRKGASLGAKHAMEAGRMEYLLHPIKECFGTSVCGYVLVIPPEHIVPTFQHQQRFRLSGGLLVPLYTDAESYKGEVSRRISDYERANPTSLQRLAN